MSKNTESQSAVDESRIEGPAPTIVGPRPEVRQSGKIAVPRGMEKLLALAGTNDEWGRRLLADPVKAANEAGIQLSSSETTVLRTIPPEILGQMFRRFGHSRISRLGDTVMAASTAAAALLAATGCEDNRATLGMRTNIPTPRSEAAQPMQEPIQWETSIEKALVKAASYPCAVMVVCQYGAKMKTRHVGPPGSLGILVEIPTSAFLSDLCQNGNPAISRAIAEEKLIAVKPPPDEKHDDYVQRLTKYNVKDAAPLVLFLAPDGSVLSQVIQPAKEKKLLLAIKAVPALLANWKASNPIVPAPPATRGHSSIEREAQAR